MQPAAAREGSPMPVPSYTQSDVSPVASVTTGSHAGDVVAAHIDLFTPSRQDANTGARKLAHDRSSREVVG